jgi:UDP-2,3-diacylglucosamine pyrophosphatase LpxH
MASENPSKQAKFIIAVSDCHLSAGRYYENQLNAHEDFVFDEEMVEMFDYFSTGKYGDGPSGPIEVELVLAGDFLDYLNVHIGGEFEDAVTEELSLRKTEAIIAGHPKVMAAIKRFAAQPGKKVTYLIGNHDADLFWPAVQEKLTREWDSEGRYPSPNVRVLANTDRLTYDCGVEIRHGNQFEPGSNLDFEKPFLTEYLDRPVLNLPWSSIYVLKIINRLKLEREFVDKVRPVKVFVLAGLLFDTLFTIRFVMLTALFFIHTRLGWSPKRTSTWKSTLGILNKESAMFLDLEREAREVLDERSDLTTVIFGHTHRPMNKVYPDGKQYINTGTWTRMVNLDYRGLGQSVRRTFAWVKIEDGRAKCDLRQWNGFHYPHQVFLG